MKSQLSITDHSRASAALHYVYPVISRRAGGLSVGINLNTNHACNWRCIYCQVPGLIKGGAPRVDLALLRRELWWFLEQVLHGEFMQQRVPSGLRRLNDIALSGDGEPTSAKEFLPVIELLVELRVALQLPATVKLVLITNGSLLHRPEVQQGLRLLAGHGGEVWFKLDRASAEGMARVNQTRMSLDEVRAHLAAALENCPNTWLQTCWFALDGMPPSRQDEEDYLALLREMRDAGCAPRGVLLYGLARPSMQPEAPRLSALSAVQLEAFAARIRAEGVRVQVSP